MLTTDHYGRITFLNLVAAGLTGWPAEEAKGQPSHNILRIIRQHTHMPAEDVIARVLREGRAVMLANHTVLLSRDGRETPIEDSAAPVLSLAACCCFFPVACGLSLVACCLLPATPL